MQFLRLGFLALGLPLLMAAAPEAPALRLPQLQPNPAPVPQNSAPQSYGPQKLTFAEGVTAQFDVPYANLRGFRPLTLDLYQPAARDTVLPLVVFVHGSDWNGGDTRHAGSFEDFPRELAALAARGYVVASVGYRLSGEARFPSAVQDVKAAIRWLRGHGGEFNIDGTRVAVWGDSAGGQLAALTGVTCGMAPFEPDKAISGDNPPSDCVQAVIDWYGITDPQSLAADSNKLADAGFMPAPSSSVLPFVSDEGDFIGCEPASCSPVLARLASPLAFVSANSPVFLIQHGALDLTVSPKQSQKLYDALRKAGVSAELIIYPDVAHNFTRDGFADPGTNRAAMEKLQSFLAATFPAAPLGQKIVLPDPRGPLYY